MAVYVGSDGYASNYNADSVRLLAKQVAEVMPKVLKHTGAQAVVVTGNSGISIAMAALMIVDFPMVLVRKESDNSHGTDIEGVLGLEFDKYIILDDFVASGRTVQRVIEKLHNKGGAECVGVLQYKTARYEATLVPKSVPMFGTDPNYWRGR